MDTAAAITVKDVADLLFAARERIDFHWNFYVVIAIAVIGWLVSLKKALTVPMKVLVSVAYVVAATMNLLSISGSGRSPSGCTWPSRYPCSWRSGSDGSPNPRKSEVRTTTDLLKGEPWP